MRPDEIILLQLKMSAPSLVPIDNRQISVRAPSATIEEEVVAEPTSPTSVTDPENSVECWICKNLYNHENQRIVVLPCGHICCFECLQHPSFQQSLKCFICNSLFRRDIPPYQSLPAEQSSFELDSRNCFIGFPGYPLTCPEVIYSTTPSQAILRQQQLGNCLYRTRQIWLFSNGEALLVELNTMEKIRVLHRWENINLAFLQSIQEQQTSTRQASEAVRMTSQASYEADVPTNIDTEEDLQGPIPMPFFNQGMQYQEFVPIQQVAITFTSPRGDDQIRSVRAQMVDVISAKDEWLIGHVVCPDIILADRTISIDPDSPFVVRNTFRCNGGAYYDYQRLFIAVNAEKEITKWAVYNFIIRGGKNGDGTPFTPELGSHSGDSTPYRTDQGLIVHELFQSEASEAHLINDRPLKNWRQTMEEYGPERLGYHYMVDIGSAWPHNRQLADLNSCQPSLLAYTRDENGLPVGYTLSPNIHLRSQSVILGMIRLNPHVEGRCDYLTLAIPTAGYANASISDIQPIIDTLSRVIVSRQEQIDSI